MTSAGVSLKLHGVTVPNNSLVDFDDLLYRTNRYPLLEDPSNNNFMLHNAALLCVTDLVDCCETPPRGDWHYPDGNVLSLMDILWTLYSGVTEVKMKSEMGDSFMVQFVCGADLLQHKKVISTVKYPVLLTPMLARPSMLMLVSLKSNFMSEGNITVHFHSGFWVPA